MTSITSTDINKNKLDNSQNRPTFSIIVPVYNVGEYINDAIMSIKNQTFRDFECIIVDDGSTDNCIKLIYPFIKDDKRFTIITQSNGGLSNARNNGYKKSYGKFVLFLDGDDKFSPHLLKRVHDRVAQSNAEIVVYNYSILDSTTGYIGHSIHELSQFTNKGIINPTSISDNIFNTFGNQVWTKVFKRDFLEKSGLYFDEKLKRAEDLPFTQIALISTNKVAVVDQSLVFYRVNRDTSNSGTIGVHYGDIFTALDKLYRFIIKKKQDLYVNSFNRLFLDNIYYNLSSTVGTEYQKKVFDLAKGRIHKYKMNIKNSNLTKKQSDLYAILDKKQLIDLLNFMLMEEQNALRTAQQTINSLDEHILQLKKSLKESTELARNLDLMYANLRQNYDGVYKIPKFSRDNWEKLKKRRNNE